MEASLSLPGRIGLRDGLNWGSSAPASTYADPLAGSAAVPGGRG